MPAISSLSIYSNDATLSSGAVISHTEHNTHRTNVRDLISNLLLVAADLEDQYASASQPTDKPDGKIWYDSGNVKAKLRVSSAWVDMLSAGNDFDNVTGDFTTGGKIVIDVDGTAINADGSITFGSGNDAAIYWDGSSLAVDSAAVLYNGGLTVGVDDTGHDVKFFGATASAFMLWDESVDTLIIRGPVGTGATGAGTITLQTAEATVVDGDYLGRIDFQAPLEGSGTDAVLVGASIWAEADDTFAADNNTTDLVFATGVSESPVERMRIDENGLNLASGDSYSIAGTSVLNATTLGTNVVSSSLTSVGTLSSLNVTGETILRTTSTDIGTNALSILSPSGAETVVIEQVGASQSNTVSLQIKSETSNSIQLYPGGDSYFVCSNGSFGIGTDSPTSGTKLHVYAGSSGASPDTDSDEIVIESSGSTGINIITPNTSSGLFYFGDPEDNNVGGFVYNHSSDTLGFRTAGAQNMTLSSSGLNLITGDVYMINGVSVISSTTLGSGVTASSLTSLGTLTSLNVTGATVCRSTATSSFTPFEIEATGGATMFSASQAGASQPNTCSFFYYYEGAQEIHLYPGGGSYFKNTNGGFGLGTTTPQNALDVSGGMVVGASYAGSSTAPSNGIGVQGSITSGGSVSWNKGKGLGDSGTATSSGGTYDIEINSSLFSGILCINCYLTGNTAIRTARTYSVSGISGDTSPGLTQLHTEDGTTSGVNISVASNGDDTYRITNNEAAELTVQWQYIGLNA